MPEILDYTDAAIDQLLHTVAVGLFYRRAGRFDKGLNMCAEGAVLLHCLVSVALCEPTVLAFTLVM